MYRIAKEFCFSASHQLTHLPPEHPCARLHGHNYRVTLILENEPNPKTGFVYDFGMLDPFKRWVDDVLDHRHLNDIFGDAMMTTSESLARAIFNHWCGLFIGLAAVRVSETEKTWAEYAP